MARVRRESQTQLAILDDFETRGAPEEQGLVDLPTHFADKIGRKKAFWRTEELTNCLTLLTF
jgi:hypothetical protein